eukprot:6211148-Pleurochrysis_carterae.AAC.1
MSPAGGTGVNLQWKIQVAVGSNAFDAEKALSMGNQIPRSTDFKVFMVRRVSTAVPMDTASAQRIHRNSFLLMSTSQNSTKVAHSPIWMQTDRLLLFRRAIFGLICYHAL